MLPDLAEEEEEDGGVEVLRGDGGGGRVVREELGWWLEGAGEAAEGGEEEAGKEERFVGEGEGIEVAKSEGEECWGREDEGEAAAVVVNVGENGVGEIGETRRREGGEGGHDDSGGF